MKTIAVIITILVGLSANADLPSISATEAGVAADHCARCNLDNLGELRDLLSNQSGGVPLENTDGVSGNVVVIRNGEVKPIGIFSLVGTGAQVTTDQHVVFRDKGEKKKGKKETSITDANGERYIARGSDDGKLYFESFYHPGRRNLIEVDLESFKTRCRLIKRDPSTQGCDGAEFRLKENALHKFQDRRMYAYLTGRPGSHDELHRSKSHYFVAGKGMVYVFHESCGNVGGKHPSMYPSLSRNIALHNCPSWENASGSSIQKVSKSKRRYLKGLHQASEGLILNSSGSTGSQSSEWVDIPKTAVLIDETRTRLMDQLFFEYLDENGIHPNDRATWPRSAFDTK